MNPFLSEWQEDWLAGLQRGRILVPLCGKTVDLPHLAGFGHEVVGVEGVRRAIVEFRDESGIDLTVRETADAFSMWEASAGASSRVTIAEGDFFEVGPAQIGANTARLLCIITDCQYLAGMFDRIWDRASLIAVKPSLRQQYVKKCSELLNPDGQILLVVWRYDQSKARGPPFAVQRGGVEGLYGEQFEVGSGDGNAQWWYAYNAHALLIAVLRILR